jgi:hypothetical protein
VNKFFKTLAKLASSSELLLITQKVRKQLAQNIEKVSDKGKKKPRQAGAWVCIFTRQV